MQIESVKPLGSAVTRAVSAPLQLLQKKAPDPQAPSALAVLIEGLELGGPENIAADYDLLAAVCALASALHFSLSGERGQARRYLTVASHSLGKEVPQDQTSLRQASPDASATCRGGLAPWQVRRVSAHIEEHLSATLHCDDLAALARLSVSHFMRAFRDSFGCSPHKYLTNRRMARAQGLMLTTTLPLGQIALDCGLADQSHLSRLFQRYVGESPAAWRRARAVTSCSAR